jgi:beta-glucosidase
VTGNLACAHIAAYRLIHRLYKERNLVSPMVSIAKNVQAFETCRSTLKNRLAVALRHNLYNIRLLNKLTAHRSLDYIGVNYYSRSLVDTKCWGLSHLLNDTCRDSCSPLKKNTLGWDVYPEGLTRVLLSFKRFNLPVFILENGICTEDDNQRWEFIRDHLKALSIAMKQGVSCLGYIYWSLLDNYEWDKGFAPRFGLIEMDYRTYQRKARDSAKRFSRVCQSGVLEE